MALVACVACGQPFYASCHDASCIDAVCPLCEYGPLDGVPSPPADVCNGRMQYAPTWESIGEGTGDEGSHRTRDRQYHTCALGGTWPGRRRRQQDREHGQACPGSSESGGVPGPSGSNNASPALAADLMRSRILMRFLFNPPAILHSNGHHARRQSTPRTFLRQAA